MKRNCRAKAKRPVRLSKVPGCNLVSKIFTGASSTHWGSRVKLLIFALF
jgi:hypothetical protein